MSRVVDLLDTDHDNVLAATHRLIDASNISGVWMGLVVSNRLLYVDQHLRAAQYASLIGEPMVVAQPNMHARWLAVQIHLRLWELNDLDLPAMLTVSHEVLAMVTDPGTCRSSIHRQLRGGLPRIAADLGRRRGYRESEFGYLGIAAEWMEVLHAALASVPHQRHFDFIVQAASARIRLLIGEVDRAASLAQQVIDGASAMESQLLSGRLARLTLVKALLTRDDIAGAWRVLLALFDDMPERSKASR